MNEIRSDREYFYKPGKINSLLKNLLEKSRYEIYELEKLQKQIERRPGYEFKMYEPVNTNLFLEEYED